jgi:hypothetical protein
MTSVTDIWFRSSATLLETAAALGLVVAVHDAEDHWEWVTGELRGIGLDITRTHTRPPRDVDVRVFRSDNRALGTDLIDLAVERVRPLAMSSIKCGRWLNRSGNDYERVVVVERG